MIGQSAPVTDYTYDDVGNLITETDPRGYVTTYTYDTAKLARENGLRNVLVTAGYINPAPWKRLLQYIDGTNIDLKGITEEFYREVCSATLKPVQQALIDAVAAGIIVEVTNLVIPTLNDKPEQIRELSRWVRANLGSDIPLHFSGFYPQYKMRYLPDTSLATLELARRIAIEEGMSFVYIGNVRSETGENTYCPGCKRLLIERKGYTILQNRLKDGCCPDCSRQIYGIWK